jgi:hypothetical protein
MPGRFAFYWLRDLKIRKVPPIFRRPPGGNVTDIDEAAVPPD